MNESQPGLLVKEIAYREPGTAHACLAGEGYSAWLDSAAFDPARGRYSYVMADPFRVIEARLGEGAPDPFALLAAEMIRWRLPPGAAPVPFAGGGVGYLGYGLGGCLERLPRRHGDDAGIPDMALGFYDVVVAFDHAVRRAWILSSGFPAEGAARSRRAAARLEETTLRLDSSGPEEDQPPLSPIAWRAELSRDEYCRGVQRVLDYIAAGDIFQVNFTTRFVAERPPALSARRVYASLRAASPAPYAALLQCGAYALASASPEKFLGLDGSGRIETRPIKGTRPRGATPGEDDALRRELEASAKDRAENLMIVDLMRNDLGRVAATGSIAVPQLCALESFASVHHLVSSVTARLRPDLGAIDLLRATFPGGSVTGAPKIRAMEIIDEVEAAARGAYCGAVVWLGFDGTMDSSIAIRTLTLTPDKIIAQAGGGIVADSDPLAEYEEMRAKVAALLLAVTGGKLSFRAAGLE